MNKKNPAVDKIKDDYTVEEVVQTFKHFRSFRQGKERIWKLVRDLHNGDFWKKIAKSVGGPQIKPDTNYLEFVESNITNSVYAANYHANVFPRHAHDNEVADKLNSFIDYKWDKLGFKEMFPRLGELSVLYNFAAVQIGWSADLIAGSSHNREQGTIEAQLIPHHQLYLDPSVTEYLSGRAIFINRQVTLFDLLNEKALREGALRYKKEVEEKNQGKFLPRSTESPSDAIYQDLDQVNEFSRKVELLECFYKVETDEGWRIDQLFIADMDYLLHVKKDIKPKVFPIRVLYGEKPSSDPYGTSLASKIVANSVALNLLDSIEGTHAHATQNRAKIFNAKSGINYRSFAKYGNTPGMAFVVQGNPSDVVQYVDVQQLPRLENLKERLEGGIQLVTGVDPRYIGRETGSIQTTGGTDLSQQRIMSTTDATRIVYLEAFVESLTELVVDYYIEYGDKYSTVPKTGLGQVKDDPSAIIDFNEIEDNKFDYTMHAAPYLPKNTMRLAEAADQLMEMQGQYQFQPPLITHEEWLRWQNFPQKEMILKRLNTQNQMNDEEEIRSILLSFAGMLDKGLDPEDAVEILVEERQAKRENPGLGAARGIGEGGQGGLL